MNKTVDPRQEEVLEILSDGKKRDTLGILEDAGNNINPRGIRTLLSRMVEQGLLVTEKDDLGVADVYSRPQE